MSEIQVSANLRIPNGMLEEFKQNAAECLKHVKEKDTETIQYDWFVNSDKTECEIREKVPELKGCPKAPIQHS